MNIQVNTALERYEVAIESLEKVGSGIEIEQVLAVLNARDAVQIALKQQSPIPTSQLKKLIDLDTILREKAELIIKVVNCETIEQLALWRESVQPSAEAWWWRLESIAPPHPWDCLDWLWKTLTVAGWTVNLSLLFNIGSRFFSQGAGLAGAAAVILPSIVALLQVNSELTKSGQEGFDKLLARFKIPQHFQQETKMGTTLLMSVILLGFWSALPTISEIYNQNGVRNHEQGKSGAAEQDYLRAMALDEDNVNAHYNLGDLYENWQQLDKAKQHYQIAVQGGVTKAYSSLSRLYIQDKKYSQAEALLTKGLLLTEEPQIPLEVRYDLLKNLGWLRFQQGRYDEAQQTILAAIGITKNPAAPQYIKNSAAAHCILAQVLEQQKQPSALSSWERCCKLGSRLNRDEDSLLYFANQKLKNAGKQCTNTGN